MVIAAVVMEGGLLVARALRAQVWIARSGVVQVVEAGGLEGAAQAGANAPLGDDLVAIAEIAGAVAAEPRIIVVAQVRLETVQPGMGLVAGEVGLDGAGRHAIGRGAVHLLLQPLHPEQRRAGPDGEVVLPQELILVGIKHILHGTVVVRMIGTHPHAHQALPPVAQAVLAKDVESGQCLVAVIVSGRGVAVVMAAPLAGEAVHADLVARRQGPGQLHGQIGVAVAVLVPVLVLVAGVTIGIGGNAVRLPVADLQAEAGVSGLTAVTGAQGSGVEAAGTSGEIRRRGALASTGENLDHSADGLGAVQMAGRPAQDLDALDLVEGNVFQGRGAGGGGADTHAVHQHQGMAGIGAAQVDGGGGAGPAAAGNFHAGLGLQQFRQGGLACGADVRGGNHRHVRHQVLDRLGRAGGGDHDVVELVYRQLIGAGAVDKGQGSQAQFDVSFHFRFP
jgi:hypothetical protein